LTAAASATISKKCKCHTISVNSCCTSLHFKRPKPTQGRHMHHRASNPNNLPQPLLQHPQTQTKKRGNYCPSKYRSSSTRTVFCGCSLRNPEWNLAGKEGKWGCERRGWRGEGGVHRTLTQNTRVLYRCWGGGGGGGGERLEGVCASNEVLGFEK